MTDSSLAITFNALVFPNNTLPHGHLSPDMRSQACWYFYTLAQLQKEKVGDSTDDQFGILEEYPWMNTHYQQTAKTVAMVYGLASPDEFAKAWDEVRAEAARLGLPEPATEYTKLVPRFYMQ